jgi:hypothetical protein
LSSKTADMAASHAQGRVLLLQRQLSKALAQQVEAAKAFHKFTNSRNNKRAVVAAAAAAMAAEAADAVADDGDSDAGVEEPVGMAANAQAAGGTQTCSSAHREPSIGPDLVLTGPRVWLAMGPTGTAIDLCTCCNSFHSSSCCHAYLNELRSFGDPAT